MPESGLELGLQLGPHKCVVLFYKYFIDDAKILSSPSSKSFTEELKTFLHEICAELQMKGRILLANEGINGTLSATDHAKLDAFIQKMEGYKYEYNCSSSSSTLSTLFRNIDWKFSEVDNNQSQTNHEPFPDLKISIVKEIVSSGGAIQVSELPKYGGKHLTPKEFHQALKEGWGGNGDESKKEVVVIDVRNTFEHNIGHFRKKQKGKNSIQINGNNDQDGTDSTRTSVGSSSSSIIKAINPQMVTFSSFDTQFCAEHADYLKDKKVLMYCTGGIRCEKASAMLKKRGVDDVNQLSGGIHRYLEEFPPSSGLGTGDGDDFDNGGYFEGKNFVFDQRVALGGGSSTAERDNSNTAYIVGSCLECGDPYDVISGSRVCTVCRDLVLICPKCVEQLREFHCERHQSWKEYYFTFLEPFAVDELTSQKEGLEKIRNHLMSGGEGNAKGKGKQKNTRRTLMKQITKIQERIEQLNNGEVQVNENAPRRCRTCRESNELCDGLCWGFWKQTSRIDTKRAIAGDHDVEKILPISVGDKVRPGPDWNEVRFGKKSAFEIGTVIEIKSWRSGGEMNDCVSVLWSCEAASTANNNEDDNKGDKRGLKRKKLESNIYRWGAVDKSGVRVYDLELIPP